MMLSILQVISVRQRASSLAKHEGGKAKRVHWSAEVDEMEKSHKVKVYPKESVSKDVFH
jgi:hypothetical protein